MYTITYFLSQADASGVFELRLLSFDNEAGKDDQGKCCTGKTDSESECDGVCTPMFRVCLKEYQVKIDTASPCTFGDVITSAGSQNDDTSQDGFTTPIRIPFPFTWPVSIFISFLHLNGPIVSFGLFNALKLTLDARW